MRRVDTIIFCCDPLDGRHVDPEFAREWEAARASGFEALLISFESLVNRRDANLSVAGVAAGSLPHSALYRGWMLTPSDYERLNAALAQRNFFLISSPSQYKLCHYLPEAYPVLEGLTPRSTWLAASSGFTNEALTGLLDEFGDSPVLVKDYVKSRKHEWLEACFVPRASDKEHSLRVIRRFLELQEEDLNEGIVLREYQKLVPLSQNLAGGMPLSMEWRVFIADGAPLIVIPYWTEASYPDLQPDLSRFLHMARRLDSPFFSMDVAKTESGEWIIVEVGDGQVSNLLGDGNIPLFYEALRDKWLV